MLEGDSLKAEDYEIIDIGDVDGFDDFRKKLKKRDIQLSYHQNYGYKFNETNKTTYLCFNKLCLKLDKQNLNNYKICNTDDNIIITNNNNLNTFEINKTQVKIYNQHHQYSDDKFNINRYEYVYDIEDNKLFFRNDNPDSLDLYEYKAFNGKEKYFYPQKQGYLGNFSRTWDQKQQPMNLLKAIVGTNNEQQHENDKFYKTCLCSANCCSGDDVDVVTDDIASLKNNPNVGTTITGRTYNTLSLEDANKR